MNLKVTSKLMNNKSFNKRKLKIAKQTKQFLIGTKIADKRMNYVTDDLCP